MNGCCGPNDKTLIKVSIVTMLLSSNLLEFSNARSLFVEVAVLTSIMCKLAFLSQLHIPFHLLCYPYLCFR